MWSSIGSNPSRTASKFAQLNSNQTFGCCRTGTYKIFNLQNGIRCFSHSNVSDDYFYTRLDATKHAHTFAPASEPARTRACLISISEAPQKYTCATTQYMEMNCVWRHGKKHTWNKNVCAPQPTRKQHFSPLIIQPRGTSSLIHPKLCCWWRENRARQLEQSISVFLAASSQFRSNCRQNRRKNWGRDSSKSSILPVQSSGTQRTPAAKKLSYDSDVYGQKWENKPFSQSLPNSVAIVERDAAASLSFRALVCSSLVYIWISN